VAWQEIGRTCGLACVAALVPGQGSSNLFPNMYCFFDLPNTFVRFSVQNYSGRPINHMVIVRCVVSECWFVLLRQTWCTLVSDKRFGSYVLQLHLMFFQSCTKLSSYTVSQKTSHPWLAITLTHMNGFWYFWQNCYGETRKSHFSLNWIAIHTQCTCALSYWKKQMPSVMCLIASNICWDSKISH